MKAVVVSRHGGPEVLEVKEVADATATGQQGLVLVKAGGVNFADIMTANGGYSGAPKPPLIAGREFCGILENNSRRVMGYAQWGAFAERFAAMPNLLWTVPHNWSDEEGAAFPVNYFTAYFAYWKAGLLGALLGTPANVGAMPWESAGKSRPRVLIHAVAGGVGTAAVQIGKVLGVELYGTSSSEEKLVRVKELGLHYGINYKQRDYENTIKDLTNGEGVDVVFEMLGGEHTAKSARCLRDFGRVIVYGNVTGERGQIDPGTLYAKGTSVHGLWLTYLSANRELMDRAWKNLSASIEQGHLRPIVSAVFPMEKAGDAYRVLLERRNFGKIVLKIA